MTATVAASTTDPRDALAALMEREGLTVSAVFVPFSQSRNAAPRGRGPDGELLKPWRSLNWRVTLNRTALTGGGSGLLAVKVTRAMITTDYSAGEGHAPSAKVFRRGTVAYEEAVATEVETGRARNREGLALPLGGVIEPDPIDVFDSLVRDADTLDAGGWGLELGYSDDSRAAEAIYQAGLAIGLAMRAGLGNDVLVEAQNLVREL